MNRTVTLLLFVVFSMACHSVMAGTCGKDFACCKGEPDLKTCAVHSDFESCVQRPDPMNYCVWADETWGCLVAYNACALSESELECQQIPGCSWDGKPFPIAAVVAPLASVLVLFGAWWFCFRKRSTDARTPEPTVSKGDSSDTTADYAESIPTKENQGSNPKNENEGDIESPRGNPLEGHSDANQADIATHEGDSEEEICFDADTSEGADESEVHNVEQGGLLEI